jgi:hypothetical protein
MSQINGTVLSKKPSKAVTKTKRARTPSKPLLGDYNNHQKETETGKTLSKSEARTGEERVHTISGSTSL